MKICLAWFPIDDPGGIINHNEQLTAGLIELGHIVETKLLYPKVVAPTQGKKGGDTDFGWAGMFFDQRRGYTWKHRNIIPYRGAARDKAVEELSKYDLVIWQVAVPTKRKENRGNTDWMYLYYECTAPQIAVIHDGNFLNSYPWLYSVMKNLKGLACVHNCAFNSAENIGLPSSLIYNPFDMGKVDDWSVRNYTERRRGFLSVQTFKAWKRVPELLRAVPHTRGIDCNLAGKGIDYYYLTSKDKCKYPGVWDAAIAHGLKYHDVIRNGFRDELLDNLTCLVDNSWSTKYSSIGGHFNRVAVEALMKGAVPVVRPHGVGTELFKDRVNCLYVPKDVTDKEYGELLTEYCSLDAPTYQTIMEGRDKMLYKFDRKYVADQYLELANGYPHRQVAETSREVIINSSKAIQEFFNADQ